MLKKLRSFFAALLLVNVLTLNANAFAAQSDAAVHVAPQQTMCWVYFAGTWWLLPC